MKELLDLAVKLYIKNTYKSNPVPEDMLDKIEYCKEILLKHSNISYVEGEYSLYFEKERVFIKEGQVLSGKDIYNHLRGYQKAIFFIVTLGIEIDKQINLLQYKDLTASYILDELASILIDIKSDKIEDSKRDFAIISDRYSCGYGDYPLSLQENICKLLCSEKIGVKLTTGGMLSPTKSISAVIGLKE